MGALRPGPFFLSSFWPTRSWLLTLCLPALPPAALRRKWWNPHQDTPFGCTCLTISTCFSPPPHSPGPARAVGKMVHCTNPDGAVHAMTPVVPPRQLQNPPTVHSCSGHFMAAEGELPSALHPLAQPSLSWGSFLCSRVLAWPRSDLPLALVRKHLPDGPSLRGLWDSIYESRTWLATFSYSSVTQAGARQTGVTDSHAPGRCASTGDCGDGSAVELGERPQG